MELLRQWIGDYGKQSLLCCTFGYAVLGVTRSYKKIVANVLIFIGTLESGIDVGQGINVGPGKFAKNNKHRASES